MTDDDDKIIQMDDCDLENIAEELALRTNIKLNVSVSHNQISEKIVLANIKFDELQEDKGTDKKNSPDSSAQDILGKGWENKYFTIPFYFQPDERSFTKLYTPDKNTKTPIFSPFMNLAMTVKGLMKFAHILENTDYEHQGQKHNRTVSIQGLDYFKPDDIYEGKVSQINSKTTKFVDNLSNFYSTHVKWSRLLPESINMTIEGQTAFERGCMGEDHEKITQLIQKYSMNR